MLTVTSMNRIYQGRVSKVEIANPDRNAPADERWLSFDSDPKLAKTKWQSALWQHHQLFQDAVNYYTLALAAMASGVEGDTAQAKALGSWVRKVRETWSSTCRKAVTFDGPQKRLALILQLPPGQDDFDTAAKRVLRPSRALPAQRAAALMQLLALKGDLNQVCVDRLPWLATAHGKLDATSKTAASSQQAKRQQIVRQFHQSPAKLALKQAPLLDLGLFLTQPPTEWVQGADALRMLRMYFHKACAKYPPLKPAANDFEQFAAAQVHLQIPSPGRKPSGLYPLAVVLKFFPRTETLAAFRQATQSLADSRDRDIIPDVLAESRVEDQPHFDYFTNLALVAGGASGCDRRAVWFEFDLTAFIEAIKAPRRYFEDMQRREEAANRLRGQIAAMHGRGHETSGADPDHEALPGFEGDTRIALLKDIIQRKLVWLGEVDEEGESQAPKEYAIGERTVRGFEAIKRRWRVAASAGHATEKHLLEILADEQSEGLDDFGGSTLYRELAKPENHSIWRDPGTQTWHAENPLAAWLDYLELREELVEKTRPIRFTPAHPVYSPRFFVFPKKNEAQPKIRKSRTSRPGLLSRHDPGQLSFTAGLILRTAEGLTPTVARLHYTAPRLYRDRLRSCGDVNLHEAPWLQPMMSALGLEQSPERVNFANCRITLQPNSESDIQLTFPVEVSSSKLRSAVAGEISWEKQFNLHPDGDVFYNTALRWPPEKQPSKPPVPWYEQLHGFHCLATDLGQRDAGAFARLAVRDDREFGGKPARFIGEAGGRRWQAALQRSGLLKLPGEDAVIWRERSTVDASDPEDTGEPFAFREELWGHRGRPARDWEADETIELMRLLESVELDGHGKEICTVLPDDWRDELSYPEQNDKLLVAMRRYQSLLTRLHRWCWFLRGDAQQQETVCKEMGECDNPRLVTPGLMDLVGQRSFRVRFELEAQLQRRLQLAPELLVRVANRILPLRGRSWHWEKHPAGTEQEPGCHLTQNGPNLNCKERPVWLRGQRGLSLERIAQIEELQKRFLALHQATRRKIGSKPVICRDESAPDPSPDLREKLANLKEQRVNQTAHMILAEALGLRLAQPPADKKVLHQRQDQHGVYEKICGPSGHCIGPVDFIIIEDLSRYRANQGRTPRENNRLMKWCHRAVRDKLKQLCEVFGLPVLETAAAHASRFCSRSSVPGFRAEEVSAGFTRKGRWAWLAGKKDEQGNPSVEARWLFDLDQKLGEAQAALEHAWAEEKRPYACPKRTLFVPSSGGPIFIPIVDSCPAAEIPPALAPAEINAAINLAFKAIADPRLWTIHPRLRCQRNGNDKHHKEKNAKPRSGKKATAPEPRFWTYEKRKFGEAGKPLIIHRAPDAKTEDTRAPCFFADFAGLEALAAKLAQEHQEFSWLTHDWASAEIPGECHAPALLHGKSFWGTLKALQWVRIDSINSARLALWKDKLRRLSDASRFNAAWA
jgi:hypothetical protein